MSPPSPCSIETAVGPSTLTSEYILSLSSQFPYRFTSFHGAVGIFLVNSRTYSLTLIQFRLCVTVRPFSTRPHCSCEFPPWLCPSVVLWRPPFWFWVCFSLTPIHFLSFFIAGIPCHCFILVRVHLCHFPPFCFCVFVHLSSVKFTPHFILEEGPHFARPPFFFFFSFCHRRSPSTFGTFIPFSSFHFHIQIFHFVFFSFAHQSYTLHFRRFHFQRFTFVSSFFIFIFFVFSRPPVIYPSPY